MSGRTSPVDLGGNEGLPPGIYVNPDTFPHSDPAQIVDQDRSFVSDRPDVAPARGGAAKGNLKKMGSFFKKGTDKLKIKKKDKHVQGGALQLGDVMGKIGGSSVGSAGTSGSGHSSKIDVTRYPSEKSKPPPLSSFERGFPSEDRSAEPHTMNSGDESKMDVLRTGFRNFFHGPPPPSPPTSPHADMDTAPLHPQPPKSPCRISIVLFVIFAMVIIIGIILLIAGAGNNGKVTQHCKVLGPCFLGLGIFGLIGEIFFMMFWKDDPLPMLNDTMAKINEKIGATDDPYGHKEPFNNTQRQSYYPGLVLQQYVGSVAMPVSPVVKESIPMYPVAHDYQMHDELPPPPPDMQAPSGPAALGFAPVDFGAPGGPAAYYDDPPSTDTSIDMRVRPGYTPPGIHNTSYQPDDSFRPQAGRII